MSCQAREPSGEGAVIVDDGGGDGDDCFGNGGGQYFGLGFGTPKSHCRGRFS